MNWCRLRCTFVNMQELSTWDQNAYTPCPRRNNYPTTGSHAPPLLRQVRKCSTK